MAESESGWYLRHRDGIEHGPFRFSDLLAAAKLGNIATDTCVRHETKTLDQWVFAPRIQAIAEAMPKGVTRPGMIRPARVTTPTTGAPSAGAPSAGAASVPPKPQQSSSESLADSTTTRNSDLTGTDAARVGDSLPRVRPPRDRGYPVPKSFGKACGAFLDPRFESFVIPWIVPILWWFSLIGAVVYSGLLIHQHFLQAASAEASGVDESVARGAWQFEPLGDQPLFQSPPFHFLIGLGGLLIGLLCLRVACELAILAIRIATDRRD